MATEQLDALIAEGLLNLRDLGGLPLVGGGETRHQRLLRSDSPHSLTQAGVQALLGAGLRTVIDLRTDSELSDHPSPLAELDGVQLLHSPIFTDEVEFPEGLVTAHDVYGWWLRELSPAVADAMTAIADAPGPPVLVHCHAGKDRTGVVVALVLSLAGVTETAIADDYALSGVQLADMLQRDRTRALDRGMDEQVAERLFTVRRDAMVRTLDMLANELGGAETFLRDAGLDGEHIERLRGLMVAPIWP